MAKVTSRYVPDNASMAKFLMSDRVGDVAMQAAEDIRQDARMRAIGSQLVDTTAYIENFLTEPSIGGHRAEGGPRRAANVYNEDEAAAPNEFGNGDQPGEHILLRSAMAYHIPAVLRRAR